MRIGIDARFYGPKQKGLGRYVQKLIEGLEKIDSSNEYIIFLRKSNWLDYQPANPNFKKVLADHAWYGLAEQFFFPRKIKEQKLDLMHFPHFNVPLFYCQPFVVTIHDLVLKKFPTRHASRLNFFTYHLKNLAYCLVIWSAIKRAKKIIAISQYTKQEILRYFKIEPEKIKVIYEGAPLSCRTLFRGSRAIAGSYLLYVGNAYPHKNLERLVIAFEKLVREGQLDLTLVLVGEIDYFYQGLKTMVNRQYPGLAERIIFTGFVADQELPALYQNACLYVFPSLCEGFGLPPLEAMSYGLPIVCSQSSCLPEILGQAVLYFDPFSPEDISRKIKEVLVNRQLREKLIAAGSETIKKYNWQKTAQETTDVYQKSLANIPHLFR